MHKFIASFICAALLIASSPAYTAEYIDRHVRDAQAVGQGRMSVLIWDVYDVTLYAPAGSLKQDQPFALALSYLRDLDGQKIADRSIEEIRGQGFADEVKLATWHTQMRKIFPDVSDGMTLTGVHTSAGTTIFYQNEEKIGQINDPLFSKAFFDIWLSEKTSAPDLRRSLLGLM
jgi:hypothetical protein